MAMAGRKPFFRPRLVRAGSPGAAPARAAAPAPGSHPGEVEAAQRFREVVLPHLDAAYNFARYLARDPTAAEDIVQDAFLRAFRAFPGWRGAPAKAWLFAIVRNCFLDWAAANAGA